MITLATLPNATAQEVFDHVANHLLKQNEKSAASEDSSACFYYFDGLKCAAGCLFNEEEYSSIINENDLEGSGWGDLVEDGHVPPQHKALIIALQSLHDNQSPAKWVYRLGKLADIFSLKFKEPQ